MKVEKQKDLPTPPLMLGDASNTKLISKIDEKETQWRGQIGGMGGTKKPERRGEKKEQNDKPEGEGKKKDFGTRGKAGDICAGVVYTL